MKVLLATQLLMINFCHIIAPVDCSRSVKIKTITYRSLQSINVNLIDTVSIFSKLNYIYIYSLLTSDDLNFRMNRPQRMIILEIFNWIYAAQDKTWSDFKLFQYLHWVKEKFDTRMCQIWTGLHTDWRLLSLTVNILGHL